MNTWGSLDENELSEARNVLRTVKSETTRRPGEVRGDFLAGRAIYFWWEGFFYTIICNILLAVSLQIVLSPTLRTKALSLNPFPRYHTHIWKCLMPYVYILVKNPWSFPHRPAVSMACLSPYFCNLRILCHMKHNEIVFLEILIPLQVQPLVPLQKSSFSSFVSSPVDASCWSRTVHPAWSWWFPRSRSFFVVLQWWATGWAPRWTSWRSWRCCRWSRAVQQPAEYR